MSRIEPSAVRNQLLAALPPVDFGRLAASLTPVDLPFKHFLSEAGQPMDAAYFIETGMVSYLASLEGGEAIEVGIIGSEGMVGLPLAFGIDRTPTAALIQLEGTALRVTAAALRQAFSESEVLRNRMMHFMQALHAQVAQTAACNSRHLLEERLARWLLMAHDRAGGDRFPMTHDFMGMMLGVRRSGVTVAAGILKKAGVIDYGNGEMAVLDRQGLEAASCECYGVVQRQIVQLLE